MKDEKGDLEETRDKRTRDETLRLWRPEHVPLKDRPTTTQTGSYPGSSSDPPSSSHSTRQWGKEGRTHGSPQEMIFRVSRTVHQEDTLKRERGIPIPHCGSTTIGAPWRCREQPKGFGRDLKIFVKERIWKKLEGWYDGRRKVLEPWRKQLFPP